MQIVAESLIFVKDLFIFVFFYSRDNDCTICVRNQTVRTKVRVRINSLITLLIHGSVSTVATTFARCMYFLLSVTVLNGNRDMIPGISSNVFDIGFSKILYIYQWRSNVMLNESAGWHYSSSILLVLSKVTITHCETWSIMCRISCHFYVYMTCVSW